MRYVERADDGDPDQYQIADQHLTTAIEHGRNQESGSERLQNSEIANLYYMRGYAWTKCYEADAPRTTSIALLNARRDFRKCKEVDPNDGKARAAIEKINKSLHRHVRESLVEVFGNLAIFLAGAIVFLKTWFWLPKPTSVTQDTAYIALTFGSLLFMVAGLYLPKVLKLKVAGIELEKASVDQVSVPSTLGIIRSKSLTK